MRTTLKRGTGRAPVANGNGNGRAVLPPDGRTVRRYRQPPPPRRGVAHVLARLLVGLVTAAAITAAGLAGGAYLYFEQTVEAVAAETPEVKLAQEQLDIAPAGEAAIALVLGYDQRVADAEAGLGTRSDTIMLMRADPKAGALSMLSLPRDLYVDIECPGKEPFRARINAAYEECGPVGTLETVRKVTGLPINYLITVNFRGFTQMVAKLGGVWIDVDRRYFNDNSQGGERFAAIDLQPGYQKLQGQDALDFVRFRHQDSDLFRIARQQMFVKAFKEAITSGFSPTRLPDIVKVITDNVEVGVAGGKSLSPRTVLSYGLFGYQLPDGHFFQTKLDGLTEDESYNIFADPASLEAAIHDFTTPDVEAPRKATDVAVGRKPKGEQAPPPAEVSVVVLNGNGVPGAAANGAYLLAQRNYRTLSPPNGAQPNAPSMDYLRSKVYFAASQEGAEPAASALARLLGDADVEPMPAGEIAQLSNGAMLAVVVGQSFTGELAPAPVDQTPTAAPPTVREDPAATEGALREVAGEVPFQLMVPTLVEQSSRLARDTPVRAYQVAGRPAVRLTFATGASDYWGIQMTTWGRAPVLSDPNETVWIEGRKYELHYVGPRLHMVVLRHAGVTYWVVNTLQNALTNETMLEIAKGLRPLTTS